MRDTTKIFCKKIFGAEYYRGYTNILFLLFLATTVTAQELSITSQYPSEIRPGVIFQADLFIEKAGQGDLWLKELSYFDPLNARYIPINLRSEIHDHELTETTPTIVQKKNFEPIVLKNKIKRSIKIQVPRNITLNKTFHFNYTISYSINGTNGTYNSGGSFLTSTNPVITRAITILIDGQRTDLLEYCVANGDCPNIKEEIFERGIRFPACTTTFPSITPTGHTAVYTGTHPGKLGITGFRWFQKNNNL